MKFLVDRVRASLKLCSMALFKKKKGAIIKFASVNENGEIDTDEFKKHITKKLR